MIAFKSQLVAIPNAVDGVFMPSLSTRELQSLLDENHQMPESKLGEHEGFAFAKQLERADDIKLMDWQYHLDLACRSTVLHAFACALLAPLSDLSTSFVQNFNDSELYSTFMCMHRDI